MTSRGRGSWLRSALVGLGAFGLAGTLLGLGVTAPTAGPDAAGPTSTSQSTYRTSGVTAAADPAPQATTRGS